jgi:hypothetical protein
MGALSCSIRCIIPPDKGSRAKVVGKWRARTHTALSLHTNATTPLEFPLIATTATQKVLSRRVDESRLFRLIEVTTDTRQKALLSSVQLKHTGDFLKVVPSPQLGLKLQ